MYYRIRVGLIIFFCCLQAVDLCGQNIYYKRYTTANDLPTSVLYKVFSDSRGFLWISGNTGITRFDGRHFLNYGISEGLADNEVFDITEDRKGNIWFTTLRGIPGYITPKGEVYAFEPKEFGDSVFVNTIEHDQNNHLWLSDNRNNIYIFEDDSLLKHYHLEGPGKVDAFIEDGSGRMWITTNNTSIVHYMDGTNLKTLRLYKEDKMYATAHRPLLLQNGNLLNYGYDHLEVINVQTREILFKREFTTSQMAPIISVYEGQNRNIWIGTTNGISVYSEQGNLDYRMIKQDMLKGEKVTSIAQDFEGHYWITTINKGLIYVTGYPVLYFKFADNRQGITLNLSCSGDYIYAGTDDGRIYAISESSLINIYSPANEYEISRVMASATLPDGSVWFGKDNGTTVVKGTRVIAELPISPVKKIEVDDEGFVWVGTSSQIFQVNPKNYKIEKQFRSGRVSAIANGHSGRIYFANENGLHMIYEDNVEMLFGTPQFGNARISDLAMDYKHNIIWVGTFGQGVFGIKNNYIEYHLDKNSGLTSNLIYSLESTEEGVLYLGLTKGINRIKPAQNGGLDIWTIDHQNGLIADEVNDIIHHKGFLWASTIDGICAIGEDEEIQNLTAPKVLLDRFRVNDEEKSQFKELILDHDENNIKVDLIGIAFQSGRALKFRYKLEGLDTNYNYSTTGKIEYNALPPGRYTLVANSVNYHNIPSDETIKLSFVIYPAYWQTIWFQLFLGVILFIIFLTGIFVRIRLIKKKESEKTRLNKMLGELELTALKAQMNPHFIFNSLGSIQNLINRDKKTEANIYLSKFAKLLRLTLDNSDKKEIPLADEINMLELYLGLEGLRFNNQFEYKIEMGESVDIYEVKIPTMILQPFCENAIKHGLLPKKADASLFLTFELQNDNTLICIIRDNGIGRVQREKLKEGSRSGHISKGIKITKNRLELVNQLRDKPAEIKITDLYHDDGQAAGTRVDIMIPLED